MPKPNQYDVFICGSGSAGVCAATWLSLSSLPCAHKIKIVESRSGPLKIGQADGVQCRTVEIFESFGMVEELLREGYHVLEDTFWNSDPQGKVGESGKKGIIRTRSVADTENGLSHCPHIILNQARINGLLIEKMRRDGGLEVNYGYEVLGVDVDEEKADNESVDTYPVTIRTRKGGREEAFEAKYVLGCDGAHSAVRRSLGFKMIGDSSDSIWGVMDIFPQTNFPDIRKKVVIQSDAGSIVIIPREGGSMVRFYIELPSGTLAKDVKLEHLQDATRQIFYPYQIDFAGTFWWSAYSIGQRLADYFSKANRVFLTGDACHTHSPKAGQGMNVSLQDGYNIGWKLASILKGQASHSLLKTYNIEREKVASTLIEFDQIWTKQMSSKGRKDENGEPIDFSEIFVKAGRFTAGLTATYEDSELTKKVWSNQELAPGLKVGMRFPSVQVVRFCDARAMQLARALPSDGRWRIIIFAGDIQKEEAAKRLMEVGHFLYSKEGLVQRFTPVGQDTDTFIETILVLSGDRVKIQQEEIPECFYPVTGKWKMRGKYLHKTYIDDKSYNSGHGKAYEFYGIGVEKGAVAVVRPDQHVSLVVDIENHKAIANFFEGFAILRNASMSNGYH